MGYVDAQVALMLITDKSKHFRHDVDTTFDTDVSTREVGACRELIYA